MDKFVVVELRVVSAQVPPQDVITRDDLSSQVDAVIHFMVTEADRAFLKVRNYLNATRQFAPTPLRSVLGHPKQDESLQLATDSTS